MSIRALVLPHLFVLLLAAACAVAHSEPQPPVIRTELAPASAPGGVRVAQESLAYVKVQALQARGENVPLRAPGRVAFRDGGLARIGAPVGARVAEVHVAVGDAVEVGAPLVSLTSPEATAARGELEQARLQVRASQDLVRRQGQLAARGVGIEVERFAAQMQLAEARARLRRAEQAAAFLGDGAADRVVVRAPIAGKVLNLQATLGASVEPGGEPLAEVGNPEALWLVAEVFEQDAGLVQVGAEVEVELGGAAERVRAQVTALGARVDPTSRRLPVYVTLQDPARALRPGMYAVAHVATSPMSGVAVPASAVLVKDGSRSIVYVASGPDSFEARDVAVGRSFAGRVEILSGLQPGDRVAVDGALLLDGSAEMLL